MPERGSWIRCIWLSNACKGEGLWLDLCNEINEKKGPSFVRICRKPEAGNKNIEETPTPSYSKVVYFLRR